MRSEIAGEDPSALELLPTERIVETRLQLQLFESTPYASGLGEHVLDQDYCCQKRLDRNHLSAICTLARIRKMRPAVQINVAEKQINAVG
jgi:hypothetical protein